MKINKFTIFLSVLAIFGAVFAFSAPKAEAACLPTDAPSITVISPNGGEVYNGGKNITVKWTSCNVLPTNQVVIGTIMPTPGTNSGQSTLGLTTINDGSEVITLPTQNSWPAMKYGLNFKVAIFLLNSATIGDFSNNLFTINPELIKLTSPNSGTFTQGQTVNITWTGGDPNGPVQVSLVKVSPFQTYTMITTTAPNTGSYSWSIPTSIPDNQYKFLVKSNPGKPTATWNYGGSITITASPYVITNPSLNPLQIQSGQVMLTSQINNNGQQNIDGIFSSTASGWIELATNPTLTSSVIYKENSGINYQGLFNVFFNSYVNNNVIQPNTTYYYKSCATGNNPVGSSKVFCGNIVSFITLPLPVIPPPVSTTTTTTTTPPLPPAAIPTPTTPPIPIPTPTTPPVPVYAPIKLTSPNSGQFTQGQQVNITWTGGDPNGPVQVSLVKVSPFQIYTTITTTAPNTGSYTWTIPNNVPDNQYKFLVKSNPGKSTATWMYGGVITIKKTAVIIYTPGTIQEITIFDNTVSGSVSATITGDTFKNAGGTLAFGTDYTLSDVPSGLTPVLIIDASGTIATLTFIGNADYTKSVPLHDLYITFFDSAFTYVSASNVVNTSGYIGELNLPNTPLNSCSPLTSVSLKNGVTYSLLQDTINATMKDGAGDQPFSFTVVASKPAQYSIDAWANNIIGFPFNSIYGMGSGEFSNTKTYNESFIDSGLSSNGSQPKNYKGCWAIQVYNYIGGYGYDIQVLHLQMNVIVTP